MDDQAREPWTTPVLSDLRIGLDTAYSQGSPTDGNSQGSTIG